MTRLLVHVEGQTEETFVREILRPHLYLKGFSTVSARLIGNARQRDRRGGIRSWVSVRTDILNHLREDPASFQTTMVDYYALPQTGSRAWPGRETAGQLPFAQKATTVEEALLADIYREMGNALYSKRFIPFVMMHEFEALLFSDCETFCRAIGHPELSANFQSIRDQFPSPEEIDDSPITAPSKRVEELIKGYEKPLLGALAIRDIGLDTIRDECPHFSEWLANLEASLSHK